MNALRGGSFLGRSHKGTYEIELALAEHQGKYMALMVKRLALPHSFTNDHKDSS